MITGFLLLKQNCSSEQHPTEMNVSMVVLDKKKSSSG